MTTNSIRARAAVVACFGALAAAWACHGDNTSSPGVPAAPADIVLSSGGGQQSVAGERLPEPISIQVLDRFGGTVKGVSVDWLALDSGVVEPAHTITDSEGHAKASWTLGLLPGDHVALATVRGVDTIEIHANATPVTLVINTTYPLHLETYDGSGQTVHPDYVNVPVSNALAGDYLGITPYPLGNPTYENPSVYTSLDRWHWSVPPMGTNPVVLPRLGYLSDPDMVFNPASSELWLYYRHVYDLNEIFLMRTSDGATWSEPELVTSDLNDLIVSPSVVRRSDSEWLMWSVHGGAGCTEANTWIDLRRSSDGRAWSAPQRVSLDQPGFTPWHVDVQWIPTLGVYWAAYNVKTPESCATPALFFATSPDGVNWKTYPSPVLARDEIPELADIVYRSTFRYRPETDAVTFWFSGARFDGTRYEWKSVVQRRRRIDLFTEIAVVPSSGLTARLRRRAVPLLTPP